MRIFIALIAAAVPAIAIAQDAPPSKAPPPYTLTKEDMAEAFARFKACWAPKITVGDPDVALYLRLDPKGVIIGEPEIRDPVDSKEFRTAAAKVIDIVKQCQPYVFANGKFQSESVLPVRMATRPKPVELPTMTTQKFDQSRIKALIDKRDSKSNPPKVDPIAQDLLKARAAWPAMFKEQIEKCLRFPTMTNESSVEFEVKYKKDGTLDGNPVIKLPKDADKDALLVATAALEALTKCQPVKLPPEVYEEWRSFIPTFTANRPN